MGINFYNNNFDLWLIGQIAATAIGFGVGIKHDWSLGCAVGFAIAVLVDIRGQLHRKKKTGGKP